MKEKFDIGCRVWFRSIWFRDVWRLSKRSHRLQIFMAFVSLLVILLSASEARADIGTKHSDLRFDLVSPLALTTILASTTATGEYVLAEGANKCFKCDLPQ